METITK